MPSTQGNLFMHAAPVDVITAYCPCKKEDFAGFLDKIWPSNFPEFLHVRLFFPSLLLFQKYLPFQHVRPSSRYRIHYPRFEWPTTK